ncbi:ATP-dependent DNA helicase [Acidovorax sp. NCPPB 3576]|uniref:ATP-dependent DNA helicase n=1 Tax=Acidovorax sp. NCPPB 3576 TaxID=2940488 RepID=UPI0023494FF5|nr:ATP-dependent DNA helicase [Acidovorax sp. NCPPB 3576]WCM90191.1 ATP-dependent DNA helicase [Acidovorax sp. NCPPB 3576]
MDLPRIESLVHAVQAAFEEGGVLSLAQAHFSPRAGQTEMALAVAETIEQGGALVVEAGTGVGKTFSYLVPALLSGERVLVSTATKALQDQLFARDLPRLVDALALPVRTALLKGRASYLCLHRMELARQDGAAHDAAVARVLARVETWSQGTVSGDLAELPGLDERSPVIALVTSTRENCLGSPCPRFRACHVHRARREALAADVVVINHHLFFADQAVRDSGMAELLPSVRVVVFDEAHQLNETGVQFMGRQASTAQLLDFSRDVMAAGLQFARGLADWLAVAAALDRAARDLRLAAGRAPAGARLRWMGEVPDGVDPGEWHAAMHQVVSACRTALAALDTVSEIAPDFVRLHGRAVQIMERMDGFSQPCGADAVRWVDVAAALRLVEAPLDIAGPMRALWHLPSGETAAAEASAWDEQAHGQEEETGARRSQGKPRAWIFTSATLGDDATLRWFTEPCGLQDARILRVESPFDYASQAAFHVPLALPKPSDPAHSAALAAWVGDAVLVLGGRTLVLTTTLKALRAIGEALQSRFAGEPGIEVLVQGQWPKRRLMERFREGASEGRAGCVLVASATFWEGFDVPGEALQLVVIDKLPFPPPGDPLVEARSQRLEQAKRSAFRYFSLPEAAITLKQGAGRLIRSETDRGVLVVADTRLVEMGYGKRLLSALPPMRRLQTAQEFDAALRALTTPSTMAPTWP